jgi:hypothetical protein
VATNRPYRISEDSAAKVSWTVENSGPGLLVVNVGRTRLRVARVATVASAAPVPSGLKTAVPCRREATRRHRPAMPLQVIITAAKTVSRASVELLSPPSTIRVTMRATSMVVTATASRRAERFTDPVGHHFGVVHGGQDGSREDQGHQGDDRDGQIPPPGQNQQHGREQGHQGRPLCREPPAPSDHAEIVADRQEPRTPVVPGPWGRSAGAT